ncbi:hypothetical protein AYO47_05775 [Planctomyces sp. SCGC AG-212-M04]|nr:hypothetical protein AYO47_05775 [Planctomyces sp. SCGC AG-212-M04]
MSLPVAGAASAVPPEEFPSTPRLLIRASAGTGKTFQLSNRYLSLLRKCPAERILAVTFTRKAAGEILERILLRLAGAVLGETKRRELSQFLGGEELTAAECDRLLASTVRQLHRVKVSTLDSFFSRLATSIPLEIGLPPRWSIADEHLSRGMMLQAVDDILRETSEISARRIVHLLAKGVVPRSIGSLLNSTVQTHYDVYRLTEAEAWRRIQPPLPLSSEAQEELLAELEEFEEGGKSLQTAIRKDVAKWRNQDWDGFLTNGPAKCLMDGKTEYNRKELPDRIIALYRRLIHHCQAILLKIWADQIAAVHELLTSFDAARRKLVAESGSLRFDDIAVALAERMREVDARSLVHRLDGEIDHLLLDEFQDTSLLQWDVLHPFVEAIERRRETSFFCVGDVKQAIYGWRGGVAALFDKVQRQVPGIRSGALNESRRSAPAIMSAVNRVFQNLDLHPNLGDLVDDVREWQASFPEHSTFKTGEPGYVRLETAEAALPDQRPGLEGKRDRCIGRSVDIVAELISNRPGLTIGVLTRKNEMIGRVIHALGERGIAASEEGGVRLATSAAVQLIQSVLRFADHPGDSIATWHIGHSPLGKLLAIQPKMEVPEAEAASLAIREELAVQGYERAVERWSRAIEPLCSARDWSRLRRLCALASEYDAAASLRPSEFANRIDEERVEEASASNVRVMTIHKSKGLEFDVVVLPDLDVDLSDTPKVCVGCPEPAERPDTVLLYRNGVLQKLLPPELKGALEQQRRADVHEALCCLYVAMTRAVHALHLVIAPQEPTKGGETTHLRTAAGLLRATLSLRPDLPAETVLYEFGNARWYEELPPAKPEEVRPASPHARSSGMIALKSRAGGRGRGREATSPSQSKGGQRLAAAKLLSLDAGLGMERGTLWHLWCQELRWLDDVSLDAAHLAAIGQPHCRQGSRLQDEIAAFRSALEKTAVRSLFERGSVARSRPDLGADLMVDCLSESGFSMLLDGRWLTGSVDRLVLYRRAGKIVGADVIDFKTDQAGEATPLRGAYREQIRQYAVAVARVYGIDANSICSKLVWLTTGTVEVVPGMPARSSLPSARVSQPRLFSEDEEGS